MRRYPSGRKCPHKKLAKKKAAKPAGGRSPAIVGRPSGGTIYNGRKGKGARRNENDKTNDGVEKEKEARH